MGTAIRPELSNHNPYWIERHRYYELKHFCLQYHSWRKACFALDGMSKRPWDSPAVSKSNVISNPTEKCVEMRDMYLRRITLLERIAMETCPYLQSYILKAVTEGLSYDHLRAKMDIPCSKDTYYHLYRRFFWLLDKARD